MEVVWVDTAWYSGEWWVVVTVLLYGVVVGGGDSFVVCCGRGWLWSCGELVKVIDA